MIGSLGEVAFVASHDLLRTFSGFSRTGAPRIAEHEVLGRKARLEFQAPGLEQITFQMRLDVLYGIHPLKEIDALRKLRDTGAILPLILAGKYHGEWCITSLGEDHQKHDGKGNVLIAVLDVQLKEVAA